MLPTARPGLGWGLLGVLAFSLTVPLTRVAVESLSPLFVGSARAVVAAAIAGVVLLLTRQAWPTPRQWRRLLLVAGGIVVGFPLLTSYAMTTAPASHGAVVIALLPAATAVTAALRNRERPGGTFWVAAGLGAVAAIGFALSRGGGVGGDGGLAGADLLLLGAVVTAAIGYAEGGMLARELGAWQTVSWALVLASPLMVALAALSAQHQPPPDQVPWEHWLAFAYLAVVSMYLGFFAWYRGLAIGPMAQVSQVQLVQPALSVAWAALLLGETVGWSTLLGAVAVVASAGLAVRIRAGAGARRSSSVHRCDTDDGRSAPSGNVVSAPRATASRR